MVRAAPGLSALFDGLERTRRLDILDLGPATDGNLRWYGPFARRVRFADLLAAREAGEAPSRTLEALEERDEGPYHLVVAWDVLDRATPRDRPVLIQGLGRLARSGARLFALFDMSERPFVPSVRYSVVDGTRVAETAVGPERPVLTRLLPAQVDGLLEPFRVARVFVLRSGVREVVAVRR